jgi:nitroreductase
MDFDEVVKRRKMIREYDSDRQQIPDEIITKLIRNTHRAPSAGHTLVDAVNRLNYKLCIKVRITAVIIYK